MTKSKEIIRQLEIKSKEKNIFIPCIKVLFFFWLHPFHHSYTDLIEQIERDGNEDKGHQVSGLTVASAGWLQATSSRSWKAIYLVGFIIVIGFSVCKSKEKKREKGKLYSGRIQLVYSRKTSCIQF